VLQTGLQLPDAQLVVPFWFVHCLPHAPQLLVLVLMLVSQPFAVLASQSLNPELQLGVQFPLRQLVVPLAFVQVAPQVPQLVALVLMLVSQPLLGLPSQSAVPAAHTGTQAPLTQLVTPLALMHFTPQPPQLFGSLAVTVSQPFLVLPSQSIEPALQTGTQAPETHDVVPWGFAQDALQAPQLLVLVFRLVSQPLSGLPSQLP
jgi:hypothetical protein